MKINLNEIIKKYDIVIEFYTFDKNKISYAYKNNGDMAFHEALRTSYNKNKIIEYPWKIWFLDNEIKITNIIKGSI